MSNEEIVKELQDGKDVTINQERLWCNNERMIYKMALKFNRGNYDIVHDLAQQGFIGMINAAKKYDLSGSAQFIYYAQPFIRGAMFAYMAEVLNPFHIPQYLRKRMRDYKDILSCAISNGEYISDDDICKKLDISEDAMKRLHQAFRKKNYLSIDAPNPDATNEINLIDRLSSNAENLSYYGNAEDYVISLERKRDLKIAIKKVLSSLDNKTEQMIRYVYYRNFSKTEVAKIMNCSESYVGARIERGFKKIRDNYGEELAEFMWDGFRYKEDNTMKNDNNEFMEQEECNLFLI